MANVGNSDERGEPSIDRLDAHGRNLLYETLLNGRKPVAMVGSGLSVVYGGVSWGESVKRALQFTIRRLEYSIAKLKRDTEPHEANVLPQSGLLAQLQREFEALQAFDDDAAIEASSDKYVALDLCSQSLDNIDALPATYREPCPLTDDRELGLSSFRAYMAKVYKDDTFYIQNLLIERFCADCADIRPVDCPGCVRRGLHIEGRDCPHHALRHRILKLKPLHVQRLACRIYSKSFLRSLTRPDSARRKQLDIILGDLEAVTSKMASASPDALHIDRRSLLCLVIAHHPPAKRRARLIGLLDDLDAESRAPAGTGATPLSAPARPILDPIRRLGEWLRVKRYVTLNFDYMLEQSLMLDDLRATNPAPYGLEEAIRDGKLQRDGDTGGLTRRFPDGLAASTDLYDEKAVGRLFEFALDSSDYRAQILHLHGRADKPSSMLLTDEDSNRQYRRSRSARTALEQALDVTLTGNPIVFVGIGLSEAEITRALRELVSRGQATAHNPVFAIMMASAGGTKSWRQQMAFYRQYGIHLINAGLRDEGWPGLLAYLDAIGKLEARIKLLAEPQEPDPALGELFRKLSEKLTDSRCDDLCADRMALAALAEEITAHHRKKVQDWELKSWKDYLDKLKAKLGTFATIRTLRSLYDESGKYEFDRRIPRRVDPQADTLFTGKTPEFDEDGTIKEVRETAGFIVRDSVLQKQSQPRNAWRHKPTEKSGRPQCPGTKGHWI